MKNNNEFLYRIGWIVSVVCLIIGIILAALGYRVGPGLVFCGVVGIAVLVAIFLLKKISPKFARQQKIEAKDERDSAIRDRAGYTTWFIMLYVLAFGAAISYFQGYEFLSNVLVAGMGAQAIVFFSSYFYYRKKF